MLETVAVAVHLQDVNVVGEPVKQSAGEPLGAEHVGPLVEGQVGGDQDGAPFVALAEDLEEESAPVVERGTKPNSSMMRSLRRASLFIWYSAVDFLPVRRTPC